MIPEALKGRDQWLLWRYEPNSDPDKKPRKVPYTHQSGARTDPTAPDGWGTFDEVTKVYSENNHYSGIGFALSEDDPFVGVDLDGCGSTIMAKHGQPVFRKSKRELQELVRCTTLPFIAKGIMTPEDAEACVEAGVSIIAVSNHGGRVLDHTPGVAEVLPEIVDRVRGKAIITADGGVRTGYDVIKMLALGADAVLLGRDVIRAAVGAGTVGVRLHMERMHKTLKQAMFMTGCSDLSSISSDILL